PGPDRARAGRPVAVAAAQRTPPAPPPAGLPRRLPAHRRLPGRVSAPGRGGFRAGPPADADRRPAAGAGERVRRLLPARAPPLGALRELADGVPTLLRPRGGAGRGGARRPPR